MRVRLPRPGVIAAVATVLYAAGGTAEILTPVVWTFATFTSPVRRAVAVAALVILPLMYARLLWVAMRRRVTVRHYIDLAVVGLIGFALPAVLGLPWANGLFVFVGLPAALLRGRPRLCALMSLAIWAAFHVTGVLLGWTVLAHVLVALLTPLVVLSTYATVWIVHVVEELREARTELARAAVGDERVRFARDLHDLLGHTLQAVALRAELAERFVRTDPDRAEAQVAEVQRIARDAVQDVREVVRGYRAISLRNELDGACAVLRAAGIDCASPAVPSALPGDVQEVLGWVVREATTNVLRHSSAARCELVFRQDGDGALLEIVNDGAGRRADRGSGSGLAGLAERVHAAGGEFSAGPAGDGIFRVVASVPTDASGAGERPEGAGGSPGARERKTAERGIV
jgi:two-component system, NarL family, sensor histidine kinase DesK